MKIERHVPPPLPCTFSMTFNQDDGWALVMALRDAYEKYDEAKDRERWREWAETLNAELRR